MGNGKRVNMQLIDVEWGSAFKAPDIDYFPQCRGGAVRFPADINRQTVAALSFSPQGVFAKGGKRIVNVPAYLLERLLKLLETEADPG